MLEFHGDFCRGDFGLCVIAWYCNDILSIAELHKYQDHIISIAELHKYHETRLTTSVKKVMISGHGNISGGYYTRHATS